MSKSVYAELRSVGFDSTYENGLRFLEWYCDRLRGEMRRAAVESWGFVQEAATLSFR
jgi:hypothetical protein